MNETIQIIKATLLDVETLEEISKRSFIETYSDKNTAENMAQYLAENFSIDALKQQINSPDSEFYLAFLNDTPIGYLKINFRNAQTELKLENAVEIERIYVLKDFQGKKAGQLLCNKAFQVGRQNKEEVLWLGVWEENLKAIRFYKKYGFTEFDTHMFMLGNDEQKDIMMKLNL